MERSGMGRPATWLSVESCGDGRDELGQNVVASLEGRQTVKRLVRDHRPFWGLP